MLSFLSLKKVLEMLDNITLLKYYLSCFKKWDNKTLWLMLKFVIVNGQYVTTRGCSTFQWEDVGARLDHRNQHIPCIRR